MWQIIKIILLIVYVEIKNKRSMKSKSLRTIVLVFALSIFSFPVFAQSPILNGNWLLDIQLNNIGILQTNIQFEVSDTGFVAYSRKDADKMILGNTKAWFARRVTKNFKNGCLIRIENGKYATENDTMRLSGNFISPVGKYIFRAILVNGEMKARLINKNQALGMVTGKLKSVQTPLENYPALFEKTVALTESNIFNKDLLQTKKWKSFSKKMRKISTHAQDDLEMVFAHYYYAGNLPFSHYYLLKSIQTGNTAHSNSVKNHVSIEEKTLGTAYMKITAFMGTEAEMDSVFQIIMQKGTKNLIVDLRNNGGGNVEPGLAFAERLVDSTFYGGVFLTQKWFNTHKQLPNISEYPKFTQLSESSSSLLLNGIHTTEGICLKVIPRQPVYLGKLYILCNGNTASTCEPIVYSLQHLKRATIVGEKTAGAMLSGEMFEVENGFSMMIPTADYYTFDGKRLDKIGVKPDVEVKTDALEYVLKNY
jgi:hypothetical protein